MQVWTMASGKTARIASGKPFRPSTTAISTSSTPRFLSSLMTRSQNLAPSVCSIHSPRISLVPSARTPSATWTAFLATFEEGPWGRKYEAIAQSWRRAWSEVVPFYAFPAEVRRLLYTTNAIEALNANLRRAVRARGHFPTDEAALKLLFLVLNRAEKEWTMPPREWALAKAQFAVLFGERFTRAMAG